MQTESTEVWIIHNRNKKGKLLIKKGRDLQMRGTNKHTETQLIHFNTHRSLSQSEENKYTLM